MNKTLAVQAWGAEFKPSETKRKPDIAVHFYSPRVPMSRLEVSQENT